MLQLLVNQSTPSLTGRGYCRPPPGEEGFLLGHFYFAIMITLLTTPGIRLMGAARLDGMQRVGEVWE